MFQLAGLSHDGSFTVTLCLAGLNAQRLHSFLSQERAQLFATYMAGVFRAVRWGAGEAHGRGAALQYGYLKEKGAFTWDAAARRYRVDDEAMQAGIAALVADLVKLQGDGDYAGMNAFFDRYAKLDEEAQSVIATLKDIPVDIAPVYPEKI